MLPSQLEECFFFQTYGFKRVRWFRNGTWTDTWKTISSRSKTKRHYSYFTPEVPTTEEYIFQSRKVAYSPERLILDRQASAGRAQQRCGAVIWAGVDSNYS